MFLGVLDESLRHDAGNRTPNLMSCEKTGFIGKNVLPFLDEPAVQTL